MHSAANAALAAAVAQALVDVVCQDHGAVRAVVLAAVGGRLERVAGNGDEVVATGPGPEDDQHDRDHAHDHRRPPADQKDRPAAPDAPQHDQGDGHGHDPQDEKGEPAHLPASGVPN